jgi:hypothetical protein
MGYYAVLYGKNSTKTFDTKSQAERFAKEKSQKMKSGVTIDRINTAGGSWSQHQVQEVKYNKNRTHHRSNNMFGGSRSRNPFGNFRF